MTLVTAVTASAPGDAYRCPNRMCRRVLLCGAPAGRFTLTCKRCGTLVEVRDAADQQMQRAS